MSLNLWPFNRHYIYWFFYNINKEVRQFKYEYYQMEREVRSLRVINPHLQSEIARLKNEIEYKQKMIDALSADIDKIVIEQGGR